MANAKSDNEIQEAVIEELAWDTRTACEKVGVSVARGVVTLTGKVPSLGKRLAIDAAVHRVAGVFDVANDIEVVPTAELLWDDTQLARAVRDTLKWDAFFLEDRIQTTVTHGVVSLYGAVETVGQRHSVENAVANLSGVRAVHNFLAVSPPPVSPTNLHAAILGALERRAEREVDKVTFDVDGDKVTVSGPVHSWTEREAILGVARGTRGVATVIDHLYVTG